MPAFSKSAAVASIGALAIVFALTAAAGAQALQTPHKPAHKVHAMAPRPLPTPFAPGTELYTSTSAAVGSENHYFSDTVASGQTDLMDQTYRYGQSSSPRYNTSEPLFRF